jgi:hypothetical protein
MYTIGMVKGLTLIYKVTQVTKKAFLITFLVDF